MPSLGRTIFRNRKIKLELRCQMYMAITVNILLWGCDTWAFMKSQLMKLRSFHHKCVRQLCGYLMFHVKEHKIKNEGYLKKAKLQPIDTLVAVRQLRFLTRVAEMDESRLTRQVMSSQGTRAIGKRAGRHKTTKQAYRDALKTAGLFTNGNDIKTNDWIECLTDEGTPSKIEQTLNLDAGTFKKKKNRKSFI